MGKADMMKKRKEKVAKPTSAAAASAAATEKIENAVKIAAASEEKKTKTPAQKPIKEKVLPVSFRLKSDTVQQLKELCALDGETATAWIEAAIKEAYGKNKTEIEAIKKIKEKRGK